jgi:hypothetical protein
MHNTPLLKKKIKKEIIFLLKGREERQLAKKITIISGGSISKFFLSNISSKKRTCHIKNF